MVDDKGNQNSMVADDECMVMMNVIELNDDPLF